HQPQICPHLGHGEIRRPDGPARLCGPGRGRDRIAHLAISPQLTARIRTMRRKKSRPTPPPAPPRPREEPFHSPFRDMREQLRAIGSPPSPAPPAATPAPPPP